MADVRDFTTPETQEVVKKEKKFLGLTGKQWAGIGISFGIFGAGYLTGQKVGKKKGMKSGHAVGRAIGAVINNCPEYEATHLLGVDAEVLKDQDKQFLQTLRNRGKIK